MSEFPVSDRTRLRRRPARGAHDETTVYAILDAGVIAHVGYTLDGEPRVTPTAYWREGRLLYWHGAAASRALRAQAECASLCVTVTHVDGFVLGRSGFAHSLLYRSVMAFGRAQRIEQRPDKRRAMDAFIERLYPGRTREIRPVHDSELDMIAVLAMPIDEASAKLRTGGVNEKDEDLAAPGWAGVIQLQPTLGATQRDERIAAHVDAPASIADFRAGARLDDVLSARSRPA